MRLVEAREDMPERPGRDIALFLAAALMSRVLFWLAMPRVIDSADAIHYIGVARHFAAGHFWVFNAKIPVLYPLFGALFGLFSPDIEFACRVASLVASTCLVIPVYLLARDIHGRSSARIAALLVVIWTWLADYGSRVSTEALACTLWFLAVWLFARALRRGGFWMSAASFAFFALHLTRPEGTFILLAAFPAAAIICARSETARPRRLIPFALVCGVLLAVHALYMSRITGTLTISHRTGFIVQDFLLSNVQRTKAGTLLLLLKTTSDTLFEVLPVMLGPVLLLFMGVGFFHPSERPRDVRLELYVLYFALVQWGLSLFVLSPAPRYLMTVLIALSLWSARGMAVVSRQAAAMPLGRWLRLLPVTALVLTMAFGAAVTLASEHLARRPRQPREYKTAGQWMKEHLEPAPVFTRKPQVGYYADMPTTGPALDDTLEEAVARAREAGTRYLVVDERYTAQMVPALEPLLDPAQAPPDLRFLHEVSPDYPDARVVIYEIVDAAMVGP